MAKTANAMGIEDYYTRGANERSAMTLRRLYVLLPVVMFLLGTALMLIYFAGDGRLAARAPGG